MKDNVIRLAPPLPEYIRKAFTGYGCIAVNTLYGCTLFIHIDSETIKACRGARINAKLQLADVDGFPLFHLEIKIYDREKPLIFDCFLDVNKDEDLKNIQSFASQESIIFYWYNEDVKYMRHSEIDWPEENRVRSAEIIEAMKNLLEKHGGGNFEVARKKFMPEG